VTAPSFRYALPSAPVAAAAVDIGHVGVTIELYLDGTLDVTADRDAEDGAIRACTLKALRAMAKGLMVSGIGSYTPTITSAAGHRFTQIRHQFREPNTMAFAGTCAINFAQRCDCGTVTVAGDAGYSLDVTALPTGAKSVLGADNAGNGRAWFVRHDEELASIGVVVLIAVPIAPGALVAS
jgi:hypothetical protein